MVDLQRYVNSLGNIEPMKCQGRITRVSGLAIESAGPRGSIGELCYIETPERVVKAQIEGFREGTTLLMPLGEIQQLSPGCQVIASGDQLKVRVGPEMTGRVLNGLGGPIDDLGPIADAELMPVISEVHNPLTRRRIKEALPLGVKAVDGFLTCGKGQRLGLFAGSGVGKSTLLGMMARNTEADVNVVALIGERGREVNDFIEKDLGPEGLKRSVLVVATSDQPPLVRLKGAFVAAAIAEYYRDLGKDVLLMMDSVTRFAMAQREVGLAIGEPPTTKGYTPSVFTELPRLLERAGTAERGTITGLYTVLVEGDDFNEPIADAVRGTLDGHIILSRQLAAQNHYPAIDLLGSISRLMPDLVTEEHLHGAGRLRAILAAYENAKDLIELGAYKSGSNPQVDEAIELIDECNALLQQDVGEKYTLEETKQLLSNLFS